ncbi:MAG: hypothetical protein A2X32_08340 [Elusimicrobia bacterium GWC2_64_44]|nr:MAG: hypothetical protein A2X32_08340 [Elusimicrobia bacterium GWC2_64_44]
MWFLKVLAYCTAFALVYSWIVVWIIERREKKYGQGTIMFSDAFLAGSLTLFCVLISNLLVFVMWPTSAASFNVFLVTLLAGFCLYRESVYQLDAKKIRHRLRAEARLVNIYISKDPANAAYYGRLCDIYAKLGEKAPALEAARMANKLEPTARNRVRIQQLQETK